MKTLKERKEVWTALLFITPFMIVFTIFNIYPEIYGFVLSFLDRNTAAKFKSNNFIGLRNYKNVLSNSMLLESVKHSLLFSVIYVVFIMVLSMIIALLLNKKFKGRGIVRTMIYMPYVTNIIAIGIVWKYLLNPFKGPVNSLLLRLGWPESNLPQWLTGLKSALPTTAMVSIWAALAFPVIVLLAALQGVPEELIEASQIEGANRWQQFWHVTFPIILPTFSFLFTLVVIDSFKTFTIISALTNGGPGTATNVMSYQLYTDAFVHMKLSYGAAEGIIMAAGIMVITVLLRLMKKKEV